MQVGFDKIADREANPINQNPIQSKAQSPFYPVRSGDGIFYTTSGWLFTDSCEVTYDT